MAWRGSSKGNLGPSVRSTVWVWLIGFLALALAACGQARPVGASTPARLPSPWTATPSRTARPATPTPTPDPPGAQTATALAQGVSPAPRATSSPTPTPEPPAPLPPLPADQTILFDRIQMMDAQEGWATTEWNDDRSPYRTYHLLRTDDGGRTWREVTPPQELPPSKFGNSYIAPFFLDGQHAWAIFWADRDTPNLIWRTSDGGRSWQAAAFEPQDRLFDAHFFFYFTDSQDGWLMNSYFLGASSYAGGIQRTHDGGQTWETVLRTEEGSFGPTLDLWALNSKVAWATSGNGAGFNPPYELHLTKDGGVSWQHIDPQDGRYPIQLAGDCWMDDPLAQSYLVGRVLRTCSEYPNPTRIYLGFTSDGGQTWRYVEIPGDPYSLGASNGWAVGEPDSATPATETYPVYRTQDGGRTWRQVGSLDQPYDLTFGDDHHGLAYGVSDLLTTSDSGQTWTPLHPTLVSSSPARDSTAWVDVPTHLLGLNQLDFPAVRLLATLDAPHATSLAANNVYIYAGLQDGRVLKWSWRFDRHIPKTLPQLRLADAWLYDVDSNPDNRALAAASRDGKVYYSDEYEFATLNVISGGTGEVSGVALLSDGVATGGEDGILRVRSDPNDVSQPWPVELAIEAHQGWLWDVAASPDESLLASGGSDGTVKLWSMDDGRNLHVLRGHSSAVTRLRFSPDGQLLASASRDGTVRIWDVASGQQKLVLNDHHNWVTDLAFSPSGDLLASVDADGRAVVWDPNTGELVRQWQAHVGAARGVVFRPDGQMLITIGDDQAMRLWGIEG